MEEGSRETLQNEHMLEILCCFGSWKEIQTASVGQELTDPHPQGKREAGTDK